MDMLQAFILGVVQGLTEFLPISSSGHLVLLQKIFGLKEGALTFDIAVHVATLVAVFFVFREDIVCMIKKPFSKLNLLIIVGTIPTAAIGFAFKDLFEELFESGATLGFEFILTGMVLWYAESFKNQNKDVLATTYMDASIIGIAQGISILPAVSRSGLTIAGALFRGLNREFAARFSFLMSIPAILGAALLDGYEFTKGSGLELGMGILPLIIGMIAASISGYVAIRFMLRVLSKGNLRMFSYYVFVLGAIIIIGQIINISAEV